MICLRPSIKFTYHVRTIDIHFLDTNISDIIGKIVSSLYRKETAKNSLLHAKSDHPMSLKRGLPYSQFTRLFRICSSRDDFEAKAQNLYSDFRSRGYPIKWLDTVLDKIRSLPEDTSLTPKNNKFSCVFKSTFSPLSPVIKQAINNYWHIIESYCDLPGLFTNPPLFVHSRPPHLRDKLVCAHTHISTPGDPLWCPWKYSV